MSKLADDHTIKKYYIVYRVVENRYGIEEKEIVTVVTDEDIAKDLCKYVPRLHYQTKEVGKDFQYNEDFIYGHR